MINLFLILLFINSLICFSYAHQGEIWAKPCIKNDDCGTDADLAFFVCMDEFCHCITYKNFVYNKTSKQCEVKEPCTSDADCQDLDLIDEHRQCKDGQCLCEIGYVGVYANGHKCTFSQLFYLLLIIPAAIIAIVIAFLFKRSKLYARCNKRIIQSLHPRINNPNPDILIDMISIRDYCSTKHKFKFNYSGYLRSEFDEPTEIGRGSFGTVVMAREKSTGKLIAIKIIKLPDDSDTIRESKYEELEILVELQSEFVVKYENSWFEKSTNSLFIQTELCQANLKNILSIKARAFKRKKYERMCGAEYFISCEIFKELIECLNYLHSFEPPIIHRDLKPANILISYHPNNNRFLRLCDFGLSKHHDKSYHTPVVGTLDYMAPEVNRGGFYNTKADIYSLGIIAEELFELNINKVSTSCMIAAPPHIRNLRETIIRMLNTILHDRPTCDELLFSVNTWTINKEDAGAECGQVLKSLKESCNEFFVKFLEIKLSSQLHNVTG